MWNQRNKNYIWLKQEFFRNFLVPRINPFHATGLFLHPPENIRKPLVFWCFQGVQKETSGLKWVNLITVKNCSPACLVPYKHITYIPRWNNVETTVSASFQRGVHVACLEGIRWKLSRHDIYNMKNQLYRWKIKQYLVTVDYSCVSETLS